MVGQFMFRVSVLKAQNSLLKKYVLASLIVTLCFRAALNLRHRFNKMRETFPRDYGDMIASYSWCTSPIPLHHKGTLLDGNLVAVEAI